MNGTKRTILIGDWVLFVVLCVSLLVLTWIVFWGPVDNYQDLKFAAWIATAALAFKFGVDLLGQFGSKILSETLMAVAAGAIASGLVLFARAPKQEMSRQTESYDVTWTFRDCSRPGMVQMQYTQVSLRSGKRGDPAWTKTFFEPYLWGYGMSNFSVQCASDQAAFAPRSSIGRPIDVPFVNMGFYFELNRSDPRHLLTIFAKDGDKMWVRVDATVDVPESYWDVAAGLVKLGSPPKFKMIDLTTKRNLAFVMAGPNDQFAHNIDTATSLIRNDCELPTIATENVVRCQVYWYPTNVLATNVHQLITNRFRYSRS